MTVTSLVSLIFAALCSVAGFQLIFFAPVEDAAAAILAPLTFACAFCFAALAHR